jgi:hypothetical protein
MSRRLTGWVLTAAVIAALPAPALSSSDPSNTLGRDFKPTAGSVGSPSLIGDDGDFTNCFEVTPVLQPQAGLPRAAGKGRPVDVYVREHPTESIASDIARAKRGAPDLAVPKSLLIDRNLTPNATARPDPIRAACGIPGGLTLLAPIAGGGA